MFEKSKTWSMEKHVSYQTFEKSKFLEIWNLEEEEKNEEIINLKICTSRNVKVWKIEIF